MKKDVKDSCDSPGKGGVNEAIVMLCIVMIRVILQIYHENCCSSNGELNASKEQQATDIEQASGHQQYIRHDVHQHGTYTAVAKDITHLFLQLYGVTQGSDVNS